MKAEENDVRDPGRGAGCPPTAITSAKSDHGHYIVRIRDSERGSAGTRVLSLHGHPHRARFRMHGGIAAARWCDVRIVKDTRRRTESEIDKWMDGSDHDHMKIQNRRKPLAPLCWTRRRNWEREGSVSGTPSIIFGSEPSGESQPMNWMANFIPSRDPDANARIADAREIRAQRKQSRRATQKRVHGDEGAGKGTVVPRINYSARLSAFCERGTANRSSSDDAWDVGPAGLLISRNIVQKSNQRSEICTASNQVHGFLSRARMATRTRLRSGGGVPRRTECTMPEAASP
ncbi:hypothetical protein BJ912DRAFT_1047074 [Pholiota molesta]|nr:hypothetical protein BJ912DRAFT_1047074 [Pholiota molesta]